MRCRVSRGRIEVLKVTKILTDDGEMFDYYKDARRHLDQKYGRQLTAIAIKLLEITKYSQMFKFLDEHLELFEAAIRLKNELTQPENELVLDGDRYDQ